MTKLYVFDIDGTLANIDHRLKWIKGPEGQPSQGFKPHWDEFFKACVDDVPIQWTINLLRRVRTLTDDYSEVALLTGRDESIRKQTEDWMRKHDVLYDYLIMRPTNDHAPDDFLKPKMLEKFLDNKDFQVEFIVEDRKRVVEAFRKKGFNVLQCAGGDY